MALEIDTRVLDFRLFFEETRRPPDASFTLVPLFRSVLQLARHHCEEQAGNCPWVAFEFHADREILDRSSEMERAFGFSRNTKGVEIRGERIQRTPKRNNVQNLL